VADRTPDAPRHRDLTGLVLLLLLGLVWGLTFPFSRLGIEGGGNPFELVTINLFLAAAVMVLIVVLSRTPRPSGRSLAQSLGVGALLIGGINLPLFWGEQFATGGAASIVYATAPAISLALLLLLGTVSRLRAVQAAALALGLLGVIVLALATSGNGPITNLWAVVAFAVGATCQGTGAVLIGRLKPQGEDRWGQAFQFLGGGTAALITLPLLVRSLALPMNLDVLASLLFVSLASLVIGYTVFFELIRREGAVTANLVTFINPVVALVVGVIAFSEAFQAYEGVGLVLILAALVLLHIPERGTPAAVARPASRLEGVAGTGGPGPARSPPGPA